jgi:hypothetical protein
LRDPPKRRGRPPLSPEQKAAKLAKVAMLTERITQLNGGEK